MQVRSNPHNPGAMALLGAFAIQQNSSDRSQSILNETMDTTFKPQHELWQPLWAAQQQAESLVTQAVTARDAAERDFRSIVSQLFHSLVYSQGKDSPIIKQYIPNGNLEVNTLPFDKQLSTFEAYAPAIAEAPDAVIGLELKQDFATKYQQGCAAQARLKAAEKGARDAQRARAAQDGDWLEAYKAYHRTVEFVAAGDRGVIQTWIRLWPEEASPQKAAVDLEKAAQRQANAQKKAAQREATAQTKAAVAATRAEAAAAKAQALAAKAAARAAKVAAQGPKRAAGRPASERKEAVAGLPAPEGMKSAEAGAA